MAKRKYYFGSQYDEMAYPMDYHIEKAKENKLNAIELFEAIPEKVDGMFFCRSVNEVGENGCCGKQCDDYSPKNGKSGMCKYKSNTFYLPGNKINLKIKY